MKPRNGVILLLIILCSVAVPVAGQSPATGESAPSRAVGLVGEMSLQVALASLDSGGARGPSPHLAANPSVVWRNGFWALGGGVKVSAPVRMPSLYIAPYARAELWFLALSGGVVMQVLDVPGVATPSVVVGLVEFAIAPDLFPALWGRIGFDASIDLYIPFSKDLGTSSVAWVPESFIATGPFRSFLERALFNPVFSLGIIYTVPL
ncbi:MAG: hypothetical protein E4H09_03595 [Spirochaetales bacterium]|nr:MAG: hypothetical protein E4H09_03595 [Spirochaetales bacterium]